MDKRLVAAGCVVSGLICLGFAIYGIRTGVVFAPQGRGNAVGTVPLYRDREPLSFWIAVWFYIGVSATLLYLAWTVNAV